jgi:hypothetical protein
MDASDVAMEFYLGLFVLFRRLQGRWQSPQADDTVTTRSSQKLLIRRYFNAVNWTILAMEGQGESIVCRILRTRFLLNAQLEAHETRKLLIDL